MGHGEEIWLKDALVFLAAAGIIVPVFKLARLSAVLGFLVAGVALGPYGLGGLAERFGWLEYVTITDPHAAEPFAELGVLFLLFLLGLELSFQRLWALRRLVFGLGGLQAGLSAAVVAATCLVIGLTAPAAVVIGLALALSSTAIVMQILAEERRAATPSGRTALAVLLMQDILVAPILILVGFLARDAGAGLGPLLLEALIQGAIALAVIFAIGRFALRPLFRQAAKAGGRDLLMALILLTVVGAGVLTAGAGLSLALGAFLAGLLLGETEFRHQAEVDLEPFKGLLLGLFFMTTGMALDLGVIAANAAIVFAGLAAMLLVKGLIVWGAARLFAAGQGVALEAAFLLAPAGEFAFVILAAAAAGEIISPEARTLAAAVAGLSMLATPFLARFGRHLAQRAGAAKEAGEGPDGAEDLEGHVVIAGFGRVGRTFARLAAQEGAQVLALDRRAEVCRAAREEGWRVYLGDAARPEILARAGAARAALFAVTVDDPDSACAMVRAARSLRPDAEILARARDADHAERLMAAGATHVTPDAVEAALQLAGRALEGFGLAPETVRDRLAQERDAAYARAGGGESLL